MSNSLYERLGVHPTASADAIQKAFRTLAKTNHPDVGGNPEHFAELLLAYQVLFDAARRDQYDRTGTFGGETDNSTALALSMVVWAFDNVMMQLNEAQAEPLEQDMVAQMCQVLAGRIKHSKNDCWGLEKTRDKYAELLGHFSVAEPCQNLLEDMLLSKIRDHNAALARGERERKDIRAAVELLTEYHFRGRERLAGHVVGGIMDRFNQ